MARNKCQHKNVVMLSVSVILYGQKLDWCKDCGATKMSSLRGGLTWVKGKWVSPEVARK